MAQSAAKPALNLPASRPENMVQPAPPVAEQISSSILTAQHLGDDALSQVRFAMPVGQGLPLSGSGPSPATPGPDMAALGLQIASELRAGTRRFEIQLDPPELGRIEVRLDIARDGRVTTQLLVDRPETLDALMRDGRGLEKALQSTGLKLEDGGLQYQLRDQSNFARHERQESSAGTPHRGGAGEPEPEAMPGQKILTEAVSQHLARGGLDIRV